MCFRQEFQRSVKRFGLTKEKGLVGRTEKKFQFFRTSCKEKSVSHMTASSASNGELTAEASVDMKLLW